jgi:murein DD-endopeptidase MepM/ murein hydrolase activator NlpD
MVFQGTRLFTPKEAAQFKAETGKTAPTHHLGVAAGRDTWLGYRPMSTRPQVFNPGNMSAIGYLPQPGTPGGGILNQALSIGRILAGGQGGVGASVGGGFVRAGLTAARGLIFGLSPATLAAAVGLIVLALVLVLLVAGTNNAPKYALFPTQTNEYQGFGADAPDVQKALAGGYFVQSFVYDGPLPPASEITQCPLDPSQIVAVLQCPGGSYSHKVVDAYDFSAFAGQPVRASHDGFIALIGYDGTYGNQVRIVSQTSSGKRYMTIYGHFKTVDPIVYEIAKGNCPEADKYNGTCLVRAGTVIGYVDSTGHSEGNHLHYEYRGPGVLQLPNNYCVGSDKYKIECTPVYPPNIVRE